MNKKQFLKTKYENFSLIKASKIIDFICRYWVYIPKYLLTKHSQTVFKTLKQIVFNTASNLLQEIYKVNKILVHTLRPQDISVIGALGDSITVSFVLF